MAIYFKRGNAGNLKRKHEINLVSLVLRNNDFFKLKLDEHFLGFLFFKPQEIQLWAFPERRGSRILSLLLMKQCNTMQLSYIYRKVLKLFSEKILNLIHHKINNNYYQIKYYILRYISLWITFNYLNKIN